MIPDKNTSSENFTGILSINDLNGDFINGYRLKNGLFKTRFIKRIKKKSTLQFRNPEPDCDENAAPDIFCDNELDEVIIGGSGSSSNYTITTPIPTGPSAYSYSFSSSSNSNYGGSSSNHQPANYNNYVNVFPCNDSVHGCQKTPCDNGNGYQDYYGNCLEDDDKIINKLTGKADCVYGKLKKLKLFKGTIKKFENNKNYNLILEEGINCNNVVADACTDSSDLANGNIRISFQSLGNNNLSLAVSMLHEGIHAEIYKYVDEYKKGLDPNDRPNLLYYYNQFKAKNALDKGTTFAQHEHMQDKYIIPIAKAIRKLDGNRYPLNEYIGFSWDGLLVYKYDKYIDSKGNLQTMTPTKRKELINKSIKIANSSKFAMNCN